MPLCGGIGATKPADESVSEVLIKIKPHLHQKLSGSRPNLQEQEHFNPVVLCYKTQVVAGTNFFVKVKVAEGDIVHVRIYRDLQQNVELHGVEEGKGEDEDISYF